ncbi:MAG: hypothetical protein ABIG44_00420 [Planctomycetota bacterium]
MAARERREIDRLVVRSDDGSYETTIVVYQDFINAAGTMVPGLKAAKTIDGHACNFKGDDEFEIVNDPHHPAMIVRRIR